MVEMRWVVHERVYVVHTRDCVMVNEKCEKLSIAMVMSEHVHVRENVFTYVCVYVCVCVCVCVSRTVRMNTCVLLDVILGIDTCHVLRSTGKGHEGIEHREVPHCRIESQSDRHAEGHKQPCRE